MASTQQTINIAEAIVKILRSNESVSVHEVYNEIRHDKKIADGQHNTSKPNVIRILRHLVRANMASDNGKGEYWFNEVKNIRFDQEKFDHSNGVHHKEKKLAKKAKVVTEVKEETFKPVTLTIATADRLRAFINKITNGKHADIIDTASDEDLNFIMRKALI
jgi:hypothetical protein